MPPPYTCQTCFKVYQRKYAYDRHCIWCTETPKDTQSRLDELQDCPSKEQMYLMIMDLSQQVKELKSTCRLISANCRSVMDPLIPTLKPSKRVVKHDVDGIDSDDDGEIMLLSKEPAPPQVHPPPPPTQSFSVWFNTIQITEQHIEYMLTNGYVNGMVFIIKQHIERTPEPAPIRILDTGIRIFRDEWERLSEFELQKYIQHVNKGLQTRFQEIYSINADSETECRHRAGEYIENVKIINALNITNPSQMIYRAIVNSNKIMV